MASGAVLVDSNILIDVARGGSRWSDWSARELERAADRGPLVINPLIYAEFSVPYDSLEAVEDAIALFSFVREPLPWEAGFLAGKAFRRYRARGGARASPLPDFYIGAHASLAGHVLLTRDPRRYREYFPRLALIAPARD